MKEKLLPFLTLFTSVSTLLCCALPAFLISLGMGAVMISLVSNFPALIWLSVHKAELFIIAAVLLSISWYLTYKSSQSCPTDPDLAKICTRLKKFNKIVFLVSIVIYLIGLFFAYGVPILLGI